MHFIFKNVFFENIFVFEIMWKNIVEPGRPQMTMWHMRIACWIPKATNTHSESEILIAFPLNNGCMSVIQHHIIYTLPVVVDIFAMQHTYPFTSLYWKTLNVIFLKLVIFLDHIIL